MKKALAILTIILTFVLAFGIKVGAEEQTISVSEVSSLSIEGYPTKTVYRAFEVFQPDGLILRATYTDGSVRNIPYSDIIVGYDSDSCFRAQDNGVTLSYGGKSVYLPLTVNRIAYDLSDIDFKQISKVYNGKYQSYTDSFTEICGLDGIPLRVSATGGGVNVGSYEIVLDFYSDSTDYFLPDSRAITMVIEPMKVDLVWNSLSFTYDGKSKLPSASYVDASGNRIYPSVIGSATNAGSGYSATAYCSDPNYVFHNPTQSFEIKKANYDFSTVKWSADSFLYDGGQKSVTATGLPSGVSIIGYINQSYSKAGSYTTTAELEWDMNNFNPPPALTHSWEIKKADYDLSRVFWQNSTMTYTGSPLFPNLIGLPDGVKVTGYIGQEAINAGSYTISVTVEYDSENYNQPYIPVCEFVIEKRPINIPHLKSVYNGKAQQPVVQSSPYVVISSEKYTDAGIYAVSLMLIDPNNYVFAETGSQVANAIYQILPADISVKVLDQRLHLFEKLTDGKYVITSGMVFADDVLSVEFYEDGNEIFIKSLNPNYSFTVDSGKIQRLPYPTFADGMRILTIALIFAALTLGIVILIRKRGEIARAFAIAKCRWHNRNFVAPPPVEHTPADLKLPDYESESEESTVIDIEDEIRFMDSEVDAERADLLITDSSAKSLIKKEGDVIYTTGSGKEQVDIGVISKSFSVGEIVDVNSLKKKGLVAKDTAYIRITSVGSLDKALTVYSNEFCLTAVKMIALSGGQAIKCITLKGKSSKNT